MSTLQLSIYDADGILRADWTDRADGLEFGTNEHGDSDLTTPVRLNSIEAFAWFNRAGLYTVEANGDGEQAWRGRLEDVTLAAGGIRIAALGLWTTLGDVPYTDTPSSPTTSDAVVLDILAAARADNPVLLSDSTALIQAPGVNVYDEEYLDADMRTVLTRLALLGDSETPPRRWEVGVDRLGRLYFRPRGSAGRDWYTDASDLELQRTLSLVSNSAYTRYDDDTLVTATASDAASIARWGVTRRRALSSRTSDASQAERERDAALEDGRVPVPRAGVMIDQLLTPFGTPSPKWMVRSGDTMTIRNLPPDPSVLIDRIRTFRIAETRYRAAGDQLTIVPEAPLPLLDVLVARSLEVPA